MARYRVTLMLNQFTMGLSETYITRDIAASGLADMVNGLLALRNAMLYDIHQWVGVRISLVDDRRRSLVALPGLTSFPGGGSINVPTRGLRTTGDSVASRPDQFRVALQVQARFNDTRTTIRYLAGIPDIYSATESGTIKFGADPAWESAFNAFRSYLITNSWAVRARTTPPTDPQYQVSDLVLETAAPGRLGVAIPNTLTPNLDNLHRVHLRGFRRRGRGGVSLNGQYYIGLINTTLLPDRTTYFLRGTEGQNPNDWKVLGTAQRVDYAIYSIQEYRPYRVGIHKRGRPSMAPRGRRLSRLTLDP